MCVLHPEDVIVTAKREKSFSHWCKKKKKKKMFQKFACVVSFGAYSSL